MDRPALLAVVDAARRPAAAGAAITAAFRDDTDTDESGRDLVNVYPGAGLAVWQAAAGRRHPGKARMLVEALTFLCPDEAAVW